MPYVIWVPPNYAPDKPWPAILFLHGSGEAGTDGMLQTEVGLARAIRRNWRTIPAIVVMPQAPPGQLWTGINAELALRCLQQTSEWYRLDADRIYLTGLSLGGNGAWYLAAKLPQAWAAVVPICGFLDNPRTPPDPQRLADDAQIMAKLPIWTFHGAQDKNVPVEQTREIVAALKAAGSSVIFSEYADGEHAIWDRAYETPELWRWVFAQKRSSAAASQPASAP